MKKSAFLITVFMLLSMPVLGQETKGTVKYDGMVLVVDSTYAFENAVVYKDSLGRTYVSLLLLVSGETLIPDKGTPYEKHGFIPFSGLTAEDLEFVVRQIRYFESDNKRKKR